MRSSLGSMKSTHMHSQIGGLGSMSMIRSTNNIISGDTKFSIADEVANFEKFFGGSPLTEKDHVDIKKSGLNLKKYENRDIYYGQTENEKPHGHGLYIFWSIPSEGKPYFYKGNFQNGEYNGFGRLCKMINDKEAAYCYQGYWKNGKREGEGKQNYKSENTMYYKGTWVNDQRQGHGVLMMPDGNYDGMWQNGKMNGEGKLTNQRGPFKTIITGNWNDDEINQGSIQYFSKSSNQLIGQYKGGIRDLMRQGEGVYRNGNIQLQGIFKQDQLIGSSTLKQSNNDVQYIIKGDFTKPYLNGLEADIKYSNNDRYQGLAEITSNNFIRKTQGKYIFADGSIVDETFQDVDQ